MLVAIVDFHAKLENVAGPNVAMKASLGRERRDGAAAKVDAAHGHPRGKLADGFRDQARREIAHARWNSENAASARSGGEVRNALDKRKRRKMITHPA